MDQFERFDIEKKPVKERLYLTPLAWLLSLPSIWYRRLKVNKVNVKGLKPPYILLCTHHAFIDFKVTTRAIFPRRANYVIAIDGFIKREKLLRNVGGIMKRKFTNDTVLFRHIKYALDKLNYIVAIYPEARYSLIGTTAILPDSLGKNG
jgi:1-acyl-sn-glycerol-3-phosphate acyltransferase